MPEKPYKIHFTGIGDPEVGYISVAQGNIHVPFDIKRVYWVYYTPEHIERGNHAHIHCRQILIAVSGIVEIELESVSGEIIAFLLDSPDQGLYVPVKYWRRIHMREDAVLLCLASDDYDEGDYIREYAIFKSGN
jgi:hypothetical protein